MLEGTLPTLRNDSHRQLLGTQVPNWTFNMDDGRRTEETLFGPVRFLRDCSVQANDSRHRHDAVGIMGDVITNDATNLGMWVLGTGFIQLALASSGLGDGKGVDV